MNNIAPNPEHVDAGEFVDYFASKTAVLHNRQIEEHVADCAACAQVSREIHTLVSATEHIGAEDVGRAFAEFALASALVRATGAESVGAILDRWRRELRQVSVGVLRTFVDSLGAGFTLSPSGSLSEWKFSPVHAMRGSGEKETARQERIHIAVPYAHLPASARVQKNGNNISLQIEDWSQDEIPLAALISCDRTGETSIGLPVPAARNGFEIRFQNVEPGAYLLILAAFKKGNVQA
jgi:hypothetical protein